LFKQENFIDGTDFEISEALLSGIFCRLVLFSDMAAKNISETFSLF
jgi:hypothetical protein